MVANIRRPILVDDACLFQGRADPGELLLGGVLAEPSGVAAEDRTVKVQVVEIPTIRIAREMESRESGELHPSQGPHGGRSTRGMLNSLIAAVAVATHSQDTTRKKPFWRLSPHFPDAPRFAHEDRV